MDEYQKTAVAAIHLDGKASKWFRSFQMGGLPVMWEELVREVSSRFSPLPHDNVVWAFKSLRQTGTAEDCQEKFKELRGVMML